MGRLAGIALALIVVASPICAQDLPTFTETHGAFALADRNGSRLLVTAPMMNPERFTSAVCAGNARLTVKFVRHQDASPKDSGRMVAENFDHMAGTLYQAVSGRTNDGATCFLAADGFLDGATVESPRRLGRPRGCDSSENRRLASIRMRGVIRCWTIIQLPAEATITVVEFAHVGDSALGSMVVNNDRSSVFADYPAQYRAGEDVWRVDDKGVLSPNDFNVVAVIRRANGYALAVSWSGSEGDLLSLFVPAEGEQLNEVINQFWYRAPQSK
jgi:hypothetical protein